MVTQAMLDAMAAGDWGMQAWSWVSSVSESAGAVLLAAIWQSAVLAAGLALCLRMMPRATAEVRFLLWGSGFAAAVSLPFLQMAVRLAASAGVAAPEGAAGQAGNPLIQLDFRWGVALACVWAAASLYRAVDLGMHGLRLRRLWRSATVLDELGVSPTSLAMHGRAVAQICTTTELERPGVIGFFAPRILIPEWLYARLTHGELEQIVLHEAEHLRRGDDWSNLLQKLSLVLFPLNPALLWMERKLCLEREMACDEGVVRITHAPRAYAACLASLAERGQEHRQPTPAGALSLGIWQRRPELARRVHSILLGRHALRPAGARALLGALACGLAIASVGLAKCPRLVGFTATPAVELARVSPPKTPVRPFAAARPEIAMVSLPAHPETASAVESKSKRRARTVLAPVSAVMTAYNSQPSSWSAQDSAAEIAPEQGWIVLTAWEVQNDGSDLPPEPGNALAASDHFPPPARQFTVTRLIFTVLPAPSRSSLPMTAPMRAGLLVLQL